MSISLGSDETTTCEYVSCGEGFDRQSDTEVICDDFIKKDVKAVVMKEEDEA